ncbi:MAG: hypothetical protein JWR56_878 [Massilia sp.]|nr:hypothetical protein [Massilia sp.]
MQNPQTPHIPGVGAVTDTLDFVKNLWGSMSLPGMNMPGLGAPVLSIDDLDKKIADLKAVESWLNVNVAMLRGTIQALEVQRGTIATLKTMGATFAEAMKQPGADEKTVLATSPYAAFFTAPAAQPAAPREAAKAAPKSAAPTEGSPLMPNPTLWWNVLQDQFKQAVENAMAPEAIAKAGAMAQEAAERMSAAATGQPASSSKAKPEGPDSGGSSSTPRAPKTKPGRG